MKSKTPWWRKFLNESTDAVGTELVVLLIAIALAVIAGIVYFAVGGRR